MSDPKQVKQTIMKGQKSICPACIHAGLCLAEGNQPCIACSHFYPHNAAPISQEARAMLLGLADDTTCPIHIAAEIEQILAMDSGEEGYPNECENGMQQKAKTNEQQFKTMDKKELATTIHALHLGYAPWCDHHCENRGDDGCDKCILSWLEKPATEE